MLSLESLSRLHFPDGCVRPEFRQKLLDSGITPEQIAWLEEDAAEEMEEWRRRKKQRCDGMDLKYSATCNMAERLPDMPILNSAATRLKCGIWNGSRSKNK